MKGKKLLNISLITLLAVSTLVMLGPMPVGAATNADSIEIIPSSVLKESTVACYWLGSTFDVEVYITNILDCAGFQFKIDYNSTLLALDSWTFDTGTPLSPTQIAPASGDRVDTDMSVAGSVQLATVWKAGIATYNGSGTAAKLTFQIIYCPPMPPPATPPDPAKENIASCDLAFDSLWTVASDSIGGTIYFNQLSDGYYQYKTIGAVAGAPVASFTWTPTLPYVCDTVICTSTSTANGGTIVQWTWTLTGPAHWLTGNNLTDPIVSFHCDGPGDVTVTLYVKDDEDMDDTITHTITQKERIGCILDLYRSPTQFCGQITSGLGVGINDPCDALSPDLNVTLFAAVSWNGKPVNHVLIAFEVVWWADPAGNPPIGGNQCVLYRTAESDKDGIARIWFRVPTPCEAMMFGKWYAYASAKIQEVKQEDWMYFDVGYLITLQDDVETFDATGQPKITFNAPCDTIFIKAHVKSISWMDKYVKFIVVVYDDCDVPIGQDIIGVTIDNSQTTYCHATDHYIYYFEVHVPQWTYVGIGKVYVSAFTALPSDCGIPYCPEVSAEIALEWSP